jgi:hypothetical protein
VREVKQEGKGEGTTEEGGTRGQGRSTYQSTLVSSLYNVSSDLPQLLLGIRIGIYGKSKKKRAQSKIRPSRGKIT